jgi:Tfp pilus assembly protein PilO
MILTSVRPRLMMAGTAAAVLVALVWYFALWAPRTSAYDKAHSEVTQSQAAIQALQAQIAQLQSQAKTGSNSSSGRQAVQAAAIPPEADLAQLIDQINTAATGSGVEFVSISPSLPVAPSAGSGLAGGSVMSVAINATGGYYQIVDFINRLDSMPRLMVVEWVSMAPGGSSASGSKSTASAGSNLTVTLNTQVFTTALPASSSAVTTTTAAAGATTTTVASPTSSSAP